MIKKICFTLLALLILAAIVEACEPPPVNSCCPSTLVVGAQEPWVCPGNCPNGGKTRIEYTIEFQTRDTKETCNPDGTLTVTVKDLTNNQELPPLRFTSPPAIPKQGSYDITLTQDTDYEITAKLDNRYCGEIKGKQKIQIVDPNDFHELCFSGPLDSPLKCSYPPINVPFGPGVLVDYVSNNSNLGANAALGTSVTKDGTTVVLQPYKKTNAFSRKPASGLWGIGLDAPSCKLYANLPEDQQTACVIIYLACPCATP